jgi:aryl-alcohol dehydrogenase-like predicted oxidoreductase
MKHSRLGRTDRTISAIGLGCATFGREIDEETSFRILDYAVDRGITFLDTAEAYGGGNAQEYRREHLGIDDVRETSGEMHSSECILGRWMQARNCHDEVTVCTKISTGNSADNISRAVRDSAERLGVETIDLFMLHTPDDLVPVDETLDALNREVVAGRVAVLGCSNHDGRQLDEALEASRRLGVARFEAVENIYNLAHREAEDDLFPGCGRHEVSFIAYSPLGAGFLTGKYTPDRKKLPPGARFHVIPGHCDDYFSDEGFAVVEELRAKADELGQSMAYLAGAWAAGNPRVACTLFGARTTKHVDNAIACLDNVTKPSRL